MTAENLTLWAEATMLVATCGVLVIGSGLVIGTLLLKSETLGVETYVEYAKPSAPKMGATGVTGVGATGVAYEEDTFEGTVVGVGNVFVTIEDVSHQLYCSFRLLCGYNFFLLR